MPWASQSLSNRVWSPLPGISAEPCSIPWPRATTCAWGSTTTSETWALMPTQEEGALRRRHKAARRAGRVSFLRIRKAPDKNHPPGRRLFLGGVLPQSMYGVQQFGLSPTAVRTLRRQAARACSTLGHGRCLTSLLALEMGEQDPAKKVVRHILELWIDIWLHLTVTQRKRVCRSWELAKPRIASATRRQRWHRVKGPLSVTVATLCELQWDPQGPVLWTTLDGAQLSLVADGAAADPRYLRREISAAIDRQLWGQAARHEQGMGSQQGVDWHATRLHLARLRKSGQHKEANFLMACFTGASWPLQQQHECPRSGEISLDPTCTRCEEGCAETFLHRHWLCAGNLFDHPNEAAKLGHERLSRRAQTEAKDTPCLWFRGLLPASHTTGLLPPPASEATAMVFGAGGASTPGYFIRNHPLYWYSDGSGGKYGHDARLVRAGWGAVGVSCKVPFPQRAAAWGALYGPLPGELQGSDRAEIWALLQLLERTLGDLVVGTDCDYLVKCFHKRWWARKGCFKNGDLWSRIGTALRIEGAKSQSTKSGRMCWPQTLLMTWQLTRGLALWAMSWLTLSLRRGPFSMRFRWTWSQPLARPTLLQSMYRSSSTPLPYRLSPN